MKYELSTLFSSKEELIEYLFVIGAQKEALDLAILDNNHSLARTLKSTYTAQISDLNEKSNKSNSQLHSTKDFCLLPQEENNFLSHMASTLRQGSKILEIGTYLGGSTVALCEGSSNNNCEITSIDIYQGFQQINSNAKLTQAANWDYNYWQLNTQKHSNRIRSFRGSATNTLRRLARDGERFDLIFLDTAHDVETYFELCLISCVASNNCILIADDVVNRSNIMLSAWALGLKNFLCHPRFFGKLAIANFKDDSTPFNFKYAASEELVSMLRKAVNDVVETKDIGLLIF